MVKLLCALLALVLATAVTAVPCIDADPPHGVNYDGFCSCYSGFINANCGGIPETSCDFNFPMVQPLATEKIVELAEVSISNGQFYFLLHAFPRQGRHFSQVGLGGTGSPSLSCSYPTSLYISKTFDGDNCVDAFESSMIADLLISTCAFASTTGESSIDLTGSLEITAVDEVAVFHGQPITRNTHASIEFFLTLPTAFHVSSGDLTVTSEIALESAITGQQYSSSEDFVSVKLTTAVQWPYTLTSITKEVGSDTFTYEAYLDDNLECPEVEDSPCFQVWGINIYGIEGSGACVVDGEYQFRFDFDCREALVTPCPVPGGNLTVDFALESSSVCSQVELSAEVSAALQSYSDPDYAEVQVAYLANSRLYFEIAVQSDISILTININDVRVVQEGRGATNILNAGEQANPLLNFVQSGTGPAKRFAFDALTGDALQGFVIFDTNKGDSAFSFTVEVDFEVTYGVTFRKRSFDTKAFKVSQQLVLHADTDQAQPKANDASTVAVTAGSLVAAALVGAAALI